MSDHDVVTLAEAWDAGYEAALADFPTITRWAHSLRGRKGTDVWAKWLALPEHERVAYVMESETWPESPFPDRTPRYMALLLGELLKKEGIKPERGSRE